MEYKTPMFDPRHEDPLSKMAEDAIEALSDIGSTIRGLFKTKEKTVSEEALCTSSYTIPELFDLSYSERDLITQPVEDVLQNVRSLVMKGYEVEFETIYNQVFSLVPSSLVSELSSVMSSCQQLSSRLIKGGESYEEIMKRYMECASDMNSFKNALGAPWIFDNLQSVGKIFDVIVKLINRFSSKAYHTIESDIIPLKPIALALLWALLLMRLSSKYTNSCADFEKERIARLSVSLVLSLFAGFTGYVHSGGYTGVPPITSWLRTYYTVRTTFERKYPYYYQKVPRLLKFNECSNFNNLMRTQQKDAGQGMNMVYTFRVGDSLLKNLEGNKLISDDVIRNTLKSVWPLPTEYEAGKMYKLYTTEGIYHIS